MSFPLYAGRNTPALPAQRQDCGRPWKVPVVQVGFECPTRSMNVRGHTLVWTSPESYRIWLSPKIITVHLFDFSIIVNQCSKNIYRYTNLFVTPHMRTPYPIGIRTKGNTRFETRRLESGVLLFSSLFDPIKDAFPEIKECLPFQISGNGLDDLIHHDGL